MNRSLLFLCLISMSLLSSNCSTNAENKSRSVSIDFDARVPIAKDAEGPGRSTVVLRMTLVNSNENIISYGLNTAAEKLQRQEYYSLNFSKDLYLLSGTDTLPCLDSHMEQLYMNLPYRTFLLDFGECHLTEQDRILIMDRVFSNRSLLVSVNKIL